MRRVRPTHRTGLHLVGLLNRENAPLIDAMATQSVDVTSVVGRPAGAALNPKPRSRLNRPFRIGLPPAVEHPMRGYIYPSWGTEAQRYLLNLLLSLLPGLQKCANYNTREKSSLTGLYRQHRWSQGPEMWMISGCSERSRHNEQSHQCKIA